MAGPQGRGYEVMTVFLFFLGLTTLACAARVYTRVYIQKAFGRDDQFAVFAWMCLTVFTALCVKGCFHGTGQHHVDIVPQSDIPVALKFWWLCEPIFIVCNMAIKASIGIMLLRLSVNRVHRIVLYVNLAVVQVYNFFFFFIFLFQCYPSQYFWTRFTGGNGSCMNPEIVVGTFYGYSAVACVTDWVFSILPCFMVWNLQMGRREKASVILILATGALASLATIVRIPYVKGLNNTDDFLYATIEVAIWSDCELGLGMTAAHCATLRPLFRRVMPSLGFNSSGGRSNAISNTKGISTIGTHKGRKGEFRSSSRNDQLELGGMEGKGFGTMTSAWHGDEERDEDASSNHSQTMIINTKTSVYRSEESTSSGGPMDWKDGR